MALLLISGRPGAGKTSFCSWLAREHGYVAVETDAEWDRWGPLLGGDQDQRTATEIRNRLRALGPDVAFEWGFSLELLPRVRQLRFAGLEPWWFGGDEPACRQNWLQRQPPLPIHLYEAQVAAIGNAEPLITRTFRDRVIDTVGCGPTFLPFEEILARVTSGLP